MEAADVIFNGSDSSEHYRQWRRTWCAQGAII
jgi:hypothetical protein